MKVYNNYQGATFEVKGIFDDELLSFKTNSNAFKVRRLYLETTDTDFYSQNNHQALQGRATEWMMLCSEAFDR